MLVLVDISYNLHDKSEKMKKKLTKAIFSLKPMVFKRDNITKLEHNIESLSRQAKI